MTRLAAQGLCVGFAERAVIADVDLAVSGGEVVGLLGPNAAGKTTLIRALANLVRPQAGTVLCDGVPVRAMPRRELARRLVYLEQGAPCYWPLSVRHLVALGRLPHLDPWRRLSGRDRRIIERAMAECDVADLADRPVTELSGGERARVLLARALATDPDILLADEPVSQLDPYHQIQVMELMRAMTDRGGAVLIVLHDLSLAARFCDRLVLLHRGEVAADGTPEQVLTAETLARVYRVSAGFVRRDGRVHVVLRDRLGARRGGASGTPRP